MSASPPRAWQRMLSGRRLDLLDPRPGDIEIADIAHGLARVARWNGQTAGPHVFSVAQHAILVEAIGADLAPEPGRTLRLELLLHDAPEYVVGDIISPLKAAIGDSYKGVERRLLDAIRARFDLASPSGAEIDLVKRADGIAAYWEATRLAGFSRAEADAIFGAPVPLSPDAEALLDPWPTAQAQARFLARFQALAGSSPRAGTLTEARTMPHIEVCPLSRLPETLSANGARDLMTLMKVGTAIARPDSIADGRHCVVEVSDIVEPLEGHELPAEAHIAHILAFARDWDRAHPLLIHCYAGISRSTAAAYIAVCALAPERDEAEIAAALRTASPSATPNRLFVALADRMLAREGRMIAAIAGIGRGRDAFEGEPFRLTLD